MKVGQVIGATDKLGASAVSRPIHFRDVLATIYHDLGIDPHGYIRDKANRPVNILPRDFRGDPRVDLRSSRQRHISESQQIPERIGRLHSAQTGIGPSRSPHGRADSGPNR